MNRKRQGPEIRLQRWELGPWSHRLPTRSFRLASLKTYRMNSTASVTGESCVKGTSNNTTTQLELPFEKLLVRPAHHRLEISLSDRRS